MQALDPETGQNQTVPSLPIPGITLSDSWRSAFGQVSAGCLSDARAVVLIGERGVGKSSLIKAWRDVSTPSFEIVTLLDASGEPDQVVAELAGVMGVDTADLGRSAILKAITANVKASREGGKETVVIVENADNIPQNTLELLMILARERGSEKPLLRYILTGTDQLRKNLKLDGTSSRRQNYLVVTLHRFTPAQTKAFAIANLARTSEISISEEAITYLHDSTAGRPANILSVLETVQQGRLEKGESEISVDHIRSLIKAPKQSKRTFDKEAGDEKPAGEASGLEGELNASTSASDAQPDSFVRSSSQVPDSIAKVNDPRPLLRWAFGLDEHSETDALAKRADDAATQRMQKPSEPSQDAPPVQKFEPMLDDVPEDLNAALARVAEREQAERNGEPSKPDASAKAAASVAAPVTAKIPPITAEPSERIGGAPAGGKNRGSAGRKGTHGEGTLEHMITSEAFTFEETKAAPVSPLENPEELTRVMREAPNDRERSGGRGNKIVLAAGVAVMGIAALGVLWTALQPTEIVNPLENPNAVELAAAPATGSAPAAVEATQAQATSEGATTTASTGPIGSGEPDLAGVIALLKAPDTASINVVGSSGLTPFSDGSPRVLQASYLVPAGINRASENLGLRQAIVSDMAESERIELAGEEQRLMENLEALRSEVENKQNTLSSLERAITAISDQTRETGSQLDNRSAEVEVVNSRLAFMARDEAQAAQRLRQITTEADDAEAKLQLMRDELSAAEALISENQRLLDENQTTTANLGEAVARREAEYAELNRKVAETEQLLTSKQSELAGVLDQQTAAQTQLGALQDELEQARSAQSVLEADLARLKQDRTTQEAAASALEAQISSADQKLAGANDALAAANRALSDKNAELAQIEANVAASKEQLGALMSQSTRQQTALEGANAELARLQQRRSELEGNFSGMTSEIAKANEQLSALAAREQTATSEFETLAARKTALEADLASAQSRLGSVTSELDQKQSEVEALTAELAAGASQIRAQESEIEALQVQSASVEAAQTTAVQNVSRGESGVEAAQIDLNELEDQQTILVESLARIERRTVDAQSDLELAERSRQEAEVEMTAAMGRLREIKAQELTAQENLAAKRNELQGLEERILLSNRELENATNRRQRLNVQLTAVSNEGTEQLRTRQAELQRIEAELEAKKAELAALSSQTSGRITVVAPAASDDVTTTVVASLPNVALEQVAPPPQRSAEISQAPAETTEEVTASVEAALADIPEDAAPQVQGEPAEVATGAGRDLDIVAAALRDAPGLGRVPQEQRDELSAALVRGECVTDALKTTFGRVNPHTLVSLLENMEMCGS